MSHVPYIRSRLDRGDFQFLVVIRSKPVPNDVRVGCCMLLFIVAVIVDSERVFQTGHSLGNLAKNWFLIKSGLVYVQAFMRSSHLHKDRALTFMVRNSVPFGIIQLLSTAVLAPLGSFLGKE